jgi:hypothetical protein
MSSKDESQTGDSICVTGEDKEIGESQQPTPSLGLYTGNGNLIIGSEKAASVWTARFLLDILL